MRLKIRRAFYTLSALNLLIFFVYLYGLASKVPKTYEKLGVDFQQTENNATTNARLPFVITARTITIQKTIRNLVKFENRTQGNCLNLQRPLEVIDRQTFQKVDNGNAIYVFSAYYDNIDKSAPIVRILGLSTKSLRNVLCQIWTEKESKTDFYETPAMVRTIPEDHGRRYSAVYVTCQLPKDDVVLPSVVSVVTKSCQKPTNFLPVFHHKKEKYGFSVCVTPFNFKYSRAYELVEMVEFNRIMGAEKVTFYNHSIGANVDAVLRQYQERGLVEVVQWHLPMRTDTWPPSPQKPEVHYFAQLAALNDCLYRHLNRSKFVVFTDMDEFVVPKRDTNWTSLVQRKLSKNPNIGAFIIRCNFFRKDWPKYKAQFEGRTEAEKYKSILLLNVLRENKAFNFFQRSKYIVVPSRIETVGIHNIWGQRPGYNIARVPSEDALLHHYRNWQNPHDGQTRVEDTGIHQYKDKLLEKLRRTWSKLSGVEMNIPLANYSKPVN